MLKPGNPPAAATAALAGILVLWLLWLEGLGGFILPGAGTAGKAPPARTPGTAPAGVFLAGHDISGWREDEVRALLREWAQEVRAEPVDARVDPASGGLIPHLNGLAVDVNATLDRVRLASPGARIPLALREIHPAVTSEEMPDRPVYRGNPAKHAVSFLINVAWGERYLPDMLRILARHGVKATFFLVGTWAEDHPREASLIAAAGHEIASHGYTTADYRQMTEDQAAQEVRRSAAAIAAATGRTPRLFSPHKGDITPAVLRAAARQGFRTVLWSLDTVDWRQPGTSWMVERILSGAHNGALILMHPTAQTVEALEPMIAGLRDQGFRIVTVGTMLSPSPQARDRGG